MGIESSRHPEYDAGEHATELDHYYERAIRMNAQINLIMSCLPARCRREARQEHGRISIGSIDITPDKNDGFWVGQNGNMQHHIGDATGIRRIVAELWASRWLSDGELTEWLRAVELTGWMEERS